MRGLRRRLSHDFGVTGDEEHGVSPPPAKKPKTSGVGHAPTAAAGAPTPKVPSPLSEVVGSKSGGVATLAHPALGAPEDEAGAPSKLSALNFLPKISSCQKGLGSSSVVAKTGVVVAWQLPNWGLVVV